MAADDPPNHVSSSSNAASAARHLDLMNSYLTRVGGTRPITRLLIANNGIAAVKAIRSLRRWSYSQFDTASAVSFVVLATPDDIRVNAEAVRMADTLVPVPGGANANNYANVPLIVDLAVRYSCDAVWAGWGHASENPALPERLAQRGVAFLGPARGPMAALGDKVASTLIAQSAGVPVVAWSGDAIRDVRYDAERGGIDEATFRAACVKSEGEAVGQADRIGYPVMVKASEGGGGKGIRLVTERSKMAAAFRQVQGEVRGSPIFIMQLVEDARHLEVQVVADMYGDAVALYGRDCSVQRRHQKIIEEGPVVAAPPVVWRELERAAVRLAKTVGYTGAGTVEYLYRGDENGGEFYFLELNPRLQVEHPVTEWIAGVNLPALQLHIAMGVPLANTPSIRRFFGCATTTVDLNSADSANAFASEPLDLSAKDPKPPHGHVIACRVTAENPDEGFQPTSGSIQELTFRNTPDVWGYFSVGTHGGVHEYADSQFGHLFAWGNTREESRRSMVLALKDLSIRGDIRTTVEYLIKLLELQDFKDNKVSTRWLDRLISEKMVPERPPSDLVVTVGAVSKAYMMFVQRRSEFLAALDRGQLPAMNISLTSFAVDLIYEDNKYCLAASLAGPQTFRVSLNGSSALVDVTALSDGCLLMLLDGHSHIAYAREESTGLRLTLNGKTCLFPKEYDPSNLLASATGKLVRYLVDDGSHVQKGDSFAELEVMKMYLALNAPESGTISLVKPPGASLEIGELLATLKLDDPTKVRRASVFEGKLKPHQPPKLTGTRPHEIFENHVSEVKLLLAGYDARADTLEAVLKMANTKELVCDQFEKAIQDLPDPHSGLAQQVETALNELRSCSSDEQFANALRSRTTRLRDIETSEVEIEAGVLRQLVDQFASEEPLAHVLRDFLHTYIASEKDFATSSRTLEDVLSELREQNREDLGIVMSAALSHANLQSKNHLVSRILSFIGSQHDLPRYSSIKSQLHELSLFSNGPYADISLKSRLILAELQQPKFSQRRGDIEAKISEMQYAHSSRAQILEQLISMPESILDVLTSLVLPHQGDVPSELSNRLVACELLISRAYRAYEVANLNLRSSSSTLHASWDFRFAQTAPEIKPIAAMLGAKPQFSVASYDSADNLNLADTAVSDDAPFRMGEIVVFATWEDMQDGFDDVLASFSNRIVTLVGVPDTKVNVLYVLVRWKGDDGASETEISNELRTFCGRSDTRSRLCAQAGIKSVTFIVAPRLSEDSYPGFYTMRTGDEFQEDLIYRNIDPPMAFQLELSRLARFDIERVSHPNRSLHVFYARAKKSKKGSSVGKDDDARFFVRAVIRLADVFSSPSDVAVTIPEAERAFAEALDAVEIGRCNRKYGRTDFNHIFLNILPTLDIDVEDVDSICRRIFQRYASRCWLQRVFTVEIRTVLPSASRDGSSRTLRFILFNPSGHMLRVEGYSEEQDPVSGTVRLVSIDRSNRGHLHGAPAQEPYPVMDRLQRKRVLAQTLETTYVYDFQHLFAKQLQEKWRKYSQARLLGGFKRNKIPVKALEVRELILEDEAGNCPIETDRDPGQNTIGMVAWRFKMYTPECPSGRSIIVIANDITFMSGSFGPPEDALFAAASRLARREGLPRIYLAANSGARIGLAEEVRQSFHVDWNDPVDPLRGFKSINLNVSEFEELCSSVELDDGPMSNRRILSIHGKEHGLGVENLVGSGLIAGETSRAYDETFTLTYVTARSVGIGAYLVRLGHRVIQRQANAPIILTGYSALNKVLGHQVYVSNDQLGGIKVMHPNGVTHKTVRDDLEGVDAILTWLSYVPRTHGDRLPVIESMDPVNRSNIFSPSSSVYDPRLLLHGSSRDNTMGLFDQGSWTEVMGGWARNVISGRARLGGIPVGIITPEIRQVQRISPADPALPETHESVVSQAGQVWYPDSAAKTAQAIRDMNREGLPLFIIANWRGFSGGMRDMFDEILKTGSQIVDALREYKQPVFVYIPPGGELRGGAWVVVDTQINPDCIEMYADPSSRGGVLEAEGTVEVKYRKREILKTMHRLDEKLRTYDAELGADVARDTVGSPLLSEERKRALSEEITRRENELLPTYRQIATVFADLHDTPGRMLRKGAVRSIVSWSEARSFFYWRLQRRIAEFRILRTCQGMDPALTWRDASSLLRKWFEQHVNSVESDAADFGIDDQSVLQWLEDEEEESIAKKLAKLRQEHVARQVLELQSIDVDGLLDGIEAVVQSMDDHAANEFSNTLQSRLNTVNSKRRALGLQSSLANTLLGRLSLRRNTVPPVPPSGQESGQNAATGNLTGQSDKPPKGAEG